VQVTRRDFVFRFRSAADWFDTFKTYYGPLVKAWAALDDAGRESLQEQLLALAEGDNRQPGGALIVPAEYLEVVVTR
jgi:hypothetical protein